MFEKTIQLLFLDGEKGSFDKFVRKQGGKDNKSYDKTLSISARSPTFKRNEGLPLPSSNDPPFPLFV